MNYDVKKNSDGLEVPAFLDETSVIMWYRVLLLT